LFSNLKDLYAFFFYALAMRFNCWTAYSKRGGSRVALRSFKRAVLLFKVQ